MTTAETVVGAITSTTRSIGDARRRMRQPSDPKPVCNTLPAAAPAPQDAIRKMMMGILGAHTHDDGMHKDTLVKVVADMVPNATPKAVQEILGDMIRDADLFTTKDMIDTIDMIDLCSSLLVFSCFVWRRSAKIDTSAYHSDREGRLR